MDQACNVAESSIGTVSDSEQRGTQGQELTRRLQQTTSLHSRGAEDEERAFQNARKPLSATQLTGNYYPKYRTRQICYQKNKLSNQQIGK